MQQHPPRSNATTRTEGSRPLKILAIGIVVTATVVGLRNWYSWSTHETNARFLADCIHLQKLRGTILQLDEVLTMSARMAAATGDDAWEKRHRQYEPELDAAIKEAINLVPEVYQSEAAAQTDEANRKLVAMENRAFEWVRQDKREAAAELLFSEDYDNQKKLYADGMAKLDAALGGHLQKQSDRHSARSFWMDAVALLAVTILVLGWIAVYVTARTHFNKQRLAEKALEDAYRGLELRVEERTKELAQANGNLQSEIAERGRSRDALAEQLRLAKLHADVAEAVSRRDDLRTILQQACKQIRDHLDVAFVRVWTLNEAKQVLELQASAGMYTHIDGGHARVPVGQFKIGRIAQNRKPYQSNDVQNDKEISNLEWANREGMVAFAGHPLMVGDQVVGVMALFAKYPLSANALATLTAVADVLAVGIQRRQIEEAFEGEQRLLTNVISTVPHHVFWKGRDLVYQGCNTEFARVAGLSSPKEIVGKTDYDLAWKKEESDWYRQCDREVMESGQPMPDIEETLRRADGTEATVLTSKVPLRDGNGEVIGILGIYADISERKTMEDAVRESETRFRMAAESVSDLVYDWDVASDHLEWYGDIDEALGFEFGEVPRTLQAWLQRIHPDDQERLRDSAEHHRGSAEPINEKYRIQRKDGTWRYWVARSRPWLDREGRPLRWVGACIDVTERDQMEKALRDSEQKFRTMAASAQDAIIMMDGDGNISFWNEAAHAAFGYTEEEAVGKHLHRLLVPQRFHESHFGAFPSFQQTGQGTAVGKTLELVGVRKNGEEFPIELSLSSVKINDRWHAIGIMRDTTDRKRAEAEVERLNGELMQASRRAGMAEVATGVLHNVGNVLNSVNVSANVATETLRASPLPGIKKISQMLAEHADDLGAFLSADEKGRRIPEYLSVLADHLASEHASVVTELESLARNIDHIKCIVSAQQSHTGAGGVRESLLIDKLVDDLLSAHAASWSRHDIDIVRDFQSIPPITVDKNKLLQIMTNLLSNARHAVLAHKGGERRITVRSCVVDEERMELSVIDSGVGIARENLLQVFSFGFTTKKDGHGFGLHSSALAAADIGGRLTADSDGPGKGATFTLELPLDSMRSGADGELSDHNGHVLDRTVAARRSTTETESSDPGVN